MTDPAKESNGSSIADRLVELIRKMPEEQQQRLLRDLENHRVPERRRAPRKSCDVAVDYESWEGIFPGFIQNTSPGGVFIKVSKSVSVGEEIALTFSSPGNKEPIKVVGKVVWSVPEGIGVALETASQPWQDLIRSL